MMPNDSAEKKTKQKDPCYKCGQLGHWISECPDEDLVMPSVPGSKSLAAIQYTAAEMWNPESPIEEPPKKKRKLSSSKLEGKKM
jgi:hypothetical protein